MSEHIITEVMCPAAPVKLRHYFSPGHWELRLYDFWVISDAHDGVVENRGEWRPHKTTNGQYAGE